MSEKLQKILARYGLGSRRTMEKWISAGRIKVNGKVAQLGARATTEDQLQVDGKRLKPPKPSSQARRVLIYHKPEGKICSRSDPKGRPTIFTDLPPIHEGRWINVGRLDFMTSGLLLITNDGELAAKLSHPSSNIERAYAVRILGEVSAETLSILTTGIDLEFGKARFTSVKFKGGENANKWYHVSLQTGRNREVRRLWESQGLKVSRLMRIAFGPIKLPPRVRQGKCLEMDQLMLKQLLELVH